MSEQPLCPDCGSRGRAHYDPWSKGIHMWQVICESCGVSGGLRDTEVGAIASWAIVASAARLGPKYQELREAALELAREVHRVDHEHWNAWVARLQRRKETMLRAAGEDGFDLRNLETTNRTCPACGEDLEANDRYLQDLHFYSRGGPAKTELTCQHCGVLLEAEEWDSAHESCYVVRLALGVALEETK